MKEKEWKSHRKRSFEPQNRGRMAWANTYFRMTLGTGSTATFAICIRNIKTSHSEKPRIEIHVVHRIKYRRARSHYTMLRSQSEQKNSETTRLVIVSVWINERKKSNSMFMCLAIDAVTYLWSGECSSMCQKYRRVVPSDVRSQRDGI